MNVILGLGLDHLGVTVAVAVLAFVLAVGAILAQLVKVVQPPIVIRSLPFFAPGRWPTSRKLSVIFDIANHQL
eukprot:8717707-Pyramimonas_sp.AAC.1